MSYKPIVQGEGETTWTENNLAFATYEEADQWGKALLLRWRGGQAADVKVSDQPVNARILNNGHAELLK